MAMESPRWWPWKVPAGGHEEVLTSHAEAKATWRVDHHRGRGPGVWAPGDVLAFDWGEIGPLFVFCAVLAWSRWRFVYFSDNLGSEATLAALAACFEELGGVPKTALTDRMGCLKGGTVAGVVVPTADYVRFATHYRIRALLYAGKPNWERPSPHHHTPLKREAPV